MAVSYEARFSQRVRQQIHGMGRKTYKMSQKFERGIPDIYMPTGIWIENKIINYGGPRGRYNKRPITALSNAQRWVMDQLSKDGDFCLIGILWMIDSGTQRFTLMPWTTFRHILQWTVTDMMHFSDELEPGKFPIPKFWDGRNIIMDTFDDRFNSWVHKNNDTMYDSTSTSDHWYYENGILIGGKNNPINLQKFSKAAIGDHMDLATWLTADEKEHQEEVEYGDESDA